MIVEVIAVGTELLLGQIVNTNAAALGTKLAEDGFDVHYHVTVGDNIDRLVDAIDTACNRSDAVILTGGIGPTQDDLTRDAICTLTGVGIERDEDHAAVIRQRLAARGVTADTALRMADYPAGAETLPNSTGVALGIATRHRACAIFAVPGVPAEMHAMVDNEVRPRLRAASGEPAVLSSRVLHTWGFGESQIAERLHDLYAATNPSIAFLINGPEVRIRITAKAPERSDVEAMISGVETEIRDRLGSAIFATDDTTVDDVVSDQLSRRGSTVAVVEASTSGMLSARLSAMPGFVGATVIATEGVDDVEARAAGLARDHSTSADIVIAVSEFAREGIGDSLEAQRVAVAVQADDAVTTRTLSILGDTERARQFAVVDALHVLRQRLTAP